MKRIVYLDTAVFIWAHNFKNSNSAKILELMNERKIKVIVSEKVLEESKTYFTRFFNEQVWFWFQSHIKSIAKVVPKKDVLFEMKKLRGKIKEKDLEHIATVKALKLEKLISYDRDFESFEEYCTPKQFIESIGLKTAETEY